jgi:hypothetical protein
MKRKCITMRAIVALGGGAFLAATLLVASVANAAQPYYCLCKGEKKRFLASSRHCELQHNVKSCSSKQYRSTYTKACQEMGCKFPND